MFSTAATAGWNCEAVSIINDEISQTVTSPGRIFGTAAEYGAPILPTTHVVRPAFRKISPASVVVVVLPFVPVTASKSPVDSR